MMDFRANPTRERFTIAAMLLAACGSCLAKQSHPVNQPTGDAATARRAIAAANQSFIAALKKSDAKAITDAFEPDAILLATGSDMLQGRDLIAAYFASLFAHRQIVESTSVTVDVILTGDTAYETGLYTLTTRAGDAAPVPDHGKYLIVWHHDADDHWRVTREISNSSVAATAPGSAPAKADDGSSGSH
jgi:uncharacterized protein (TIGR02246 family)